MSVNVVCRSAAGASLVPADSLLMEKRILTLNGVVDAQCVSNLVQQIAILAQKSDAPILIMINSLGGNVQDGLVLLDLMTGSSIPIYTLCLGACYSMAALILSAGKKGYRWTSEHSRIMIHEPLLGNGVGGSCTSIQAIARSIASCKDMTNGILAKNTGRTIEEIEEATSYDHFFSAKEAMEFGLVDGTLSGDALMRVLKGDFQL